MSESWTRIENWLAQHAPAAYAALAPPATPVEIAETERIIGAPLLRPLVASLLRHNGLVGGRFTLLPGYFEPLSAREIADAWKSLTPYHDQSLTEEEEADADDDFLTSGFGSYVLYGHPDMIPFARDNSGQRLVLDHRRWSDRGRVHETDPADGLRRVAHDAWKSLPALLEGMADALETGRPLNGYMPAVDEEGGLCWDFERRWL
ncbi:SMI1/KNR4 family protein [Streptomyces sp. NPDC089799]|uniref:SMI1/KNR4 family protein n=1 Tax=Streptomyces sp. NPDC089799 TaxID=3155066 RepID=UPI003413529E